MKKLMNLSKSSLFRVLLLTLILPSLSQCTALRESLGFGLRKPKVSLAGIKITKASAKEVILNVSLNIENSNNFELNFSELDYTFFINQAKIAQGQVKEQITVKAQRNTILKLPLKLQTDSLFQILTSSFLNKTDIISKWDAVAKFHSPLGAIKVSFKEEKKLEF